MSLLFPLGLLALAAWAVPLLLHLARREQRIPTDFAALRWLAIRAKPRSRLRFDEIALLLARLALVAAFAVLLARPALVGGDDGVREVVAIHPALDDPGGERVLSPDAGDTRVVWLAPGFPPIDAPPDAPDVATASLVRELDASLAPATRLRVIVPSWFDGADGERIRLSREVLWEIAAVDDPDIAAVDAPAAPRLAIRHDAAHAGDVRWLRAVAVAWQATVADESADVAEAGDTAEAAAIDIAPHDAPLPEGEDVAIAWLVGGALPPATRAWIEHGGRALLAHDAGWPLDVPGAPIADDDGVAIAEAAPLGRGLVVRLRLPLRAADWPALLEPDFPHHVRTLLTPPPPAPARADAAALAPGEGGPGFAPTPREFPSLLAALLVALFALERWLATGRRAEPAA